MDSMVPKNLNSYVTSTDYPKAVVIGNRPSVGIFKRIRDVPMEICISGSAMFNNRYISKICGMCAIYVDNTLHADNVDYAEPKKISLS